MLKALPLSARALNTLKNWKWGVTYGHFTQAQTWTYRPKLYFYTRTHFYNAVSGNLKEIRRAHGIFGQRQE